MGSDSSWATVVAPATRSRSSGTGFRALVSTENGLEVHNRRGWNYQPAADLFTDGRRGGWLLVLRHAHDCSGRRCPPARRSPAAVTRSGRSRSSAADATVAPTTNEWPSYDQSVTAHRDERDAFVAAAREYCELYEGAQELGAERFLLGLARALPRLHAAGFDLQYPDDELPADDVDVGLTTEEMQSFAFPVGDVLREIDWSRLHGELRESVGVDPRAWQIDVFLYDDLYDIYRDLRDGFRLLDAGRPESEAVFQWRLSFWSHWGYHSVDALRGVHYYVALYLTG
jgi:hypothetical protein